jgi:uncharacterized protein (TIGR02099 family)
MTDRQANGSTTPASPAAGGHAAQIVHSVEQVVEHAVEAAEQSLAARLGAGGMSCLIWSARALGWLALAAYSVFCLILIGLRLWWMPHINDWRGDIETGASAILQQQVTIGHIESSWLGINPRLQLTDVQLHDARGGVLLTLPQIEAVMSWTSIPTLRAQVKSLTVLAPEIEVRRISESRLKIAGILIDLEATDSGMAPLNWLLEQRHVAVSHATVHYYDEAEGATPAVPVDMTDVELLCTHHFGTHRFALRARPPSDIADLIDVRGWFDHPWSVPVSNPSAWSGRLYAQLNYVDLARLESFARLIPAPFRLHRGNGALRTWIDFDALTVQRARVDLAFTDVDLRLRSDLQPLRLTSLQGRITQQAWRTGSAQGQDIALTHLALDGPAGLHLPPTDLTYRASRAMAPANAPLHTEVSVNVLSLTDLAALASHVPLPAQAQDLIDRHSMRGNLADLHASWDGEPDQVSNIALQTRFDRLAVAAQPAEPLVDSNDRPRAGQPGFENLSGSIDLSQAGGVLALNSSDAHLFFPGIFEDPELIATRLETNVHWKSEPALEVVVDAFAFSSEDLQISAAGTYRSVDPGAGWADLTASLTRANAAAAHRYVPMRVNAGTRTWLRDALRDGRVSAGTLKLRGKLDDFPFVARDSGDFQASLHVSGATLDYAPSTAAHVRGQPWPVMTGVEADLNFNRDQIEIRGGQATVHGVRLSKVAGLITQRDSHEPQLVISGQGNGDLADLVGFVNDSPVGQLIGRSLETTKASGPGRLQIKLDIPLNHAVDTQVVGSVFFQNNDVVLRSDVAPLTAVSGRLDFNQHGIQISGLSAGFVGGQARVDADMAADGALVVKIAGGATPLGLRRQLESALVRRLLDSARGMARYTAVVTLHAQSVEVHAASDLSGLAIDLPEPMAKVAGDTLPLRVDLVPTPGTAPMRDSVQVTVGSLVYLQLERVAGATPDGSMHIERGVLAIGAPSALPEAGLMINLSLARLDTDRWLPLLESAPDEASGSAFGTVPDLIAAHIDELWVSGKPLKNVVLGASRTPDGGWNANIDADRTSGSLHWLSGTRSAPGHLTARLARLTIPESAREQVTEVLDAPARELPELDVVADDFVLGSSRLGRLELDAQNSGGGRTNTWQVKRLQIENPDARISGTGQWQREPGSQARRMSLAIALDIVNAGNLLGRFGLPGALKNGSGKLTANLSWLGSPFSIDYPSLSGELRLSAEKGQFLKIDPGAGRLLGVMSLQALPRRISLDFRDIFSHGFAFDKISATAQISKGVLSTHDFKMAGVNASVLIEGDTDLQSESQNLRVLVLPEINAGSASVVYAFIANPAIGIGTFLAQWVLRHPLSKIFSYEYDVTGSWADPLVKRHERQKTESSPEKTDNPSG